jgi:hypothetical protein
MTSFDLNYAHNNHPITGAIDENPPPHPCYQARQLVIDPQQAFLEPSGVNRFLPLPTFDRPYFVWRDQTVNVQGGNSGEGSDVMNANQSFAPYILTPFLGGDARKVTVTNGVPSFNNPAWGNFREFWLAQTTRPDNWTGGGLGTIALPLLADFKTLCDDPERPAGNGFIASGFNGWQISLAVQSAPQPNFRAFSGGFGGGGTRPPVCVAPGTPDWVSARGGFNPLNGSRTPGADNSVYWLMADFLKRQTVVTSGYVEVLNPHRMPIVPVPPMAPPPTDRDPRLGPYFPNAAGNPSLPLATLPRFDYVFEPPLELLPAGTAVVPQFSGASMIDEDPWRWRMARPAHPLIQKPNAKAFALNPLAAGDAYIRKFDDRGIPGASSRNWWAFYYNRHVTDYTDDLNDLMDDDFLSPFAGPNESLTPRDIVYFNWRFIMRNNVDSNPPVSPTVESFSIAYRFEGAPR